MRRRNVILVSPGDVDDMRRKIALLMGDPGLRERKGANGRRWAQLHAGREEWSRMTLDALSGPTGARRFNTNGLGEQLTGIYLDHHSLGQKKWASRTGVIQCLSDRPEADHAVVDPDDTGRRARPDCWRGQQHGPRHGRDNAF